MANFQQLLNQKMPLFYKMDSIFENTETQVSSEEWRGKKLMLIFLPFDSIEFNKEL